VRKRGSHSILLRNGSGRVRAAFLRQQKGSPTENERTGNSVADDQQDFIVMSQGTKKEY